MFSETILLITGFSQIASQSRARIAVQMPLPRLEIQTPPPSATRSNLAVVRPGCTSEIAASRYYGNVCKHRSLRATHTQREGTGSKQVR